MHNPDYTVSSIFSYVLLLFVGTQLTPNYTTIYQLAQPLNTPSTYFNTVNSEIANVAPTHFIVNPEIGQSSTHLSHPSNETPTQNKQATNPCQPALQFLNSTPELISSRVHS